MDSGPAGDTNHRPVVARAAGRPLSLRPPLRHSGEGRNPGEGWAAGAIFHTLVCRPQPAWVIPMETCLGSINEPLIAIFIYEPISLATIKYIYLESC